MTRNPYNSRSSKKAYSSSYKNNNSMYEKGRDRDMFRQKNGMDEDY